MKQRVFRQRNRGLNLPVGNLDDIGIVNDIMGCWRTNIDSKRRAGAMLEVIDIASNEKIHTLDSSSGPVSRFVLAMCKFRTQIIMLTNQKLLDCSCNNANYQTAIVLARVSWSSTIPVVKKGLKGTTERKKIVY